MAEESHCNMSLGGACLRDTRAGTRVPGASHKVRGKLEEKGPSLLFRQHSVAHRCRIGVSPSPPIRMGRGGELRERGVNQSKSSEREGCRGPRLVSKAGIRKN